MEKLSGLSHTKLLHEFEINKETGKYQEKEMVISVDKRYFD